MKKILITLFASIFLISSNANAAISNWKENESKGAKVRILSSFYNDKETGEKKLIAGVHFKIEKGWHIYGHGADGIGISPKFTLDNSTNYKNYQIFWPAPIVNNEKIGDEEIKYLTYEDEVIIPLLIETKDPNKDSRLLVNLSYGLCKDICIPAQAEIALNVENKIDEKTLQQIQKFYPNNLGIELEQYIDPQLDEEKDSGYNLVYILLAALIGGAILNIMPCVLPVLSIKLISIITHTHTEISRIRFAFFSTILGILFCFIIFASLAAIIKITGNSLGWGLQFQNPYFLIFLIVILIFFIANLLGTFEITFSQFISNILNKKIDEGEKSHNIFMPNFLSGILAVLLATPCSAPFLGSAISFALVQDFWIINLVFLAIGIGFALPYIILIFSPKLIYLLPKPGEWMVKVKQWMAGFLVATVVWLIYILTKNIGSMPAFVTALLAIGLITSLKIKTAFLRYLAVAISIIAIFCLPNHLQQKQEIKDTHFNSVWEKFDESKIEKYVLEGKVVVVDVTAEWCITCKFNKIRVLQSKEIMEKLKNPDIIAMRGDLTKPNEEILNFLHKYNRYAIPFNIVFGPSAKQGILTSELLSKKELLEAIKKAQ